MTSFANRSEFRNLYILDYKQPKTVLDDLCVADGIIHKTLFSMFEIIFIFNSEFEVFDERGRKIEANRDLLTSKNNYVDDAFVLIIFDNQLACLFIKKQMTLF